ncbi:bestrophin-like domain [Streptomyces sp. SS8]
MSEWLFLLLTVVASCAAVVAVALLRRRRVGEGDDPSETPDVIEYMTMMIGVVYAIVLGLAIAGVWEGRSAAEDWTRQEARALHEVRERAQAYPAAARDRVRGDVDAYVHHVVTVEWPHMTEHGETTDRGALLLDRLRRNVTDYDPATVREAQTYQSLVDQVAAVDEARTARVQGMEPTLPGVVWSGLVAGAAIAVGMVFALQIQRSGRELVLAGLFTALITFLLFLVWYFDSPFTRGLEDPSEVFTVLLPRATGG